MRYGILGSSQARQDDGTDVPLPGGRLRALLAALALRGGRPVPAWALIEEIWDADPPADPADALQTLVARLRRALGADAVASGPEGYRLVDGERTDLAEFELLVGCAEDAAPADRARHLRDALALWRGAPLADLPTRQDAAVRLAAQREAALRARIEADLALGGAAEVLPELVALTADAPLDEPLQALHLVALTALGRTPDALVAYERFRRRLADELGTDPGPELRAVYAQLLAPAAPSANRPRRRGNLRPRLTSFVGREEELSTLDRALASARLLTLTGPGGTGKTRLAQEAADRAGIRYPDGAWLVELAPLDDPAAVADAVLSSLGLRATQLHVGGRAAEVLAAAQVEQEPALDRLLEYCAERSLLLVLDNCEHLVEAAARLAADLLAGCPGVTVLATSREPLGVPGEQVVPLEPLSDPTALRLLAERGATARPGFEVDADPAACAEICRRLDGLPLAIELAAARLRGLTPRQLADRLDGRFQLLTGGSRIHLPRQQTLRAVVDWSWDLLDKPERLLLARLAVFAGGCTLVAAEEICADDAELPRAEVAPTLLALVDKSLVQARLEDGEAEPRYMLLETILEYAGERLGELPDHGSELRTRHTAWYRELARRADPVLRTVDQLDALRLLEAEHDNLRAALRRSIAAGQEQEALALCLALAWFWMLRNYRAEAHQWFRAAQRLAPDEGCFDRVTPVPDAPLDLPLPWPDPVLDEARRAVTLSAFITADADFGSAGGPETREQAVRLLNAYPPELPQSARLPGVQLAYVAMFAGVLDSLQATVDGLVASCRAQGREWELACVLQIRSKMLNDDLNTRERALADAQESLEIFTRFGDRWGMAEALAGCSEVAVAAGEFAQAADQARQALAHARALGAEAEVPVLRIRLGDALLGLGEEEAGERELREGIAEAREFGSAGEGAAYFGSLLLAGLTARRGEQAEARALLEGLLRSQQGAATPSFGTVLAGMVTGMIGWIDADEGHPEQGLRRLRDGLAMMTAHPLLEFVADQLPMLMVPPLCFILTRLAQATDDTGPAREAAVLLGAFDTLKTRAAAHHMEQKTLVTITATLQELLGDAAFATAHAEGATLTAAQVLERMR